MLSSMPFNESYNQRPLNISKELAKMGYKILFVSWQWSPQEIIPNSYEEVFNGIFQIPLYDFLNSYNEFSFLGKEKIFYISFPAEHFLPLIRPFRYMGFKIIYDIMDDWEGFYEVGQAPWYKREIEERFLLEADYLFAVNDFIYKKFEKLRKDIILLGNGFNEEILGKDAKFIAGRDIDNEKIIVGYYGWLTESLIDWDYIFKLAELYKEIKIQIIGYGLSEKIKEKLENYGNIEFIGRVHPTELKNYVSKWNIGLIPFSEKVISKGADPLKFYEYIYFGLPTAVKGLNHLRNYPFIYYLEKPEDFSQILKEVDTKEKIEKYREKYKEAIEKFLNDSKWETRVKNLLDHIKGETFWH